MQLTPHATRRTAHGASRLVQAMPAWSLKTRHAQSRPYRDARVYGHSTTAMNEYRVHLPTTTSASSTLLLLISPSFSSWLGCSCCRRCCSCSAVRSSSVPSGSTRFGCLYLSLWLSDRLRSLSFPLQQESSYDDLPENTGIFANCSLNVLD